jgi:hypothetical protein
MKRILIVLAVVVAAVVVGFFALNSYIYKEKQEGPMVEPYFGTLSGVQVCLPHKDTTEEQTLECAAGMKTDSGEYYVLDLDDATNIEVMKGGTRFTAVGTITPIELLSSDHWQKYQVSGIFSVTGEVKTEAAVTAPEAPATPAPTKPEGKCYVGGCSSQLCTDKPDMMSTCEYTEAYGCYKTATCERQSTGACGWTQTPELKQCLLDAR